jgi:hypothetical protein
VDVTELSREQLIELKQNYLCSLDDSGDYSEVFDVDHIGVSYSDLLNADDIVPDDVVFDNYFGVIFCDDDFICSAN